MTLLVTATAAEAEPFKTSCKSVERLEFPLGELYRLHFAVPLYLAHLGVGKVNTAAGLALALERLEPAAVIQFGIGGAFVGSFLSVGMVAVAAREVHLDTGVRTDAGWESMESLGFPLLKGDELLYNIFPTDQILTQKIVEATGAHSCTFGTSETVTGSFDDAQILHERFDVSLESMEGAAAAQVCLALGVPFAELRGVSNIVGERDKRAWDVPAAVRAVNGAVERFLDGLAEQKV